MERLIFRGGCELRYLPHKTKEAKMKQINVAHTILSRDWKGLSNHGSNGVVEVWEDNSSRKHNTAQHEAEES